MGREGGGKKGGKGEGRGGERRKGKRAQCPSANLLRCSPPNLPTGDGRTAGSPSPLLPQLCLGSLSILALTIVHLTVPPCHPSVGLLDHRPIFFELSAGTVTAAYATGWVSPQRAAGCGRRDTLRKIMNNSAVVSAKKDIHVSDARRGFIV